MIAEIVTREDAWVLGTMDRINPMQANYRDLWDNHFGPHEAVVTALATELGYYGLYYGTGQEGQVDFLAGMVVAERAAVPAGLTLRALPGGQYAAFSCTMVTIGPTWGGIYSLWLPTSDYREDPARPGFEYFASDDMSPEAPVMIYVPIVRR